jgi:putative hydrolase of the HAD superfamily
VGSITNGFGSAAGAGLGEFFDFEISAEALIDEHMVHGEMARKPNAYPFQLAMGIAIADHGYSGDADSWTHVGDDVLNDCYCAKQFDFKTVHVCDPKTKPYESGGGAPYVEKSLRGGVEANSDAVVDGVISHVRELPELLDRWYV